MTLARTFDAGLVNAIMSDAFGEPMDFTGIVGDPANYALVGDLGCMLFERSKPGIYALTMGIREPGRGGWAKAFVDEALHFMFTETDAMRLWSTVMRGKRHVIALAAHAPGIEIEHTEQHSLAAVTKERWYAKTTRAAQ